MEERAKGSLDRQWNGYGRNHVGLDSVGLD